MNQFQNGTYCVGIMNGFVSQPWTNDPNKFNHRILLANPYLDNNGFQQTEVITIDVSADDVQRVQGLCNQLKDKQVIVLTRFDARKGGKNGAWLSRFMPRGANIQTLDLSEMKKVS